MSDRNGVTWINTYARIFATDYRDDRDPGVPQYLSVIGISDIVWDIEVRRVCYHCGSYVSGDACAGCGSRSLTRSEYSLGSAVATLVGRMPFASEIFWLKSGATIDVAVGFCGRPDVYRREDIKFRLMGCNVIGKSIPMLTALSSDEVSEISLYVDVSCEVELYPHGLPE